MEKQGCAEGDREKVRRWLEEMKTGKGRKDVRKEGNVVVYFF